MCEHHDRVFDTSFPHGLTRVEIGLCVYIHKLLFNSVWVKHRNYINRSKIIKLRQFNSLEVIFDFIHVPFCVRYSRLSFKQTKYKKYSKLNFQLYHALNLTYSHRIDSNMCKTFPNCKVCPVNKISPKRIQAESNPIVCSGSRVLIVRSSVRPNMASV